MAEIEVEGKTVEAAITEGLAKLGVSREQVEIKILNEGTTGLFGLMGTKPARVLLVTKEGVHVQRHAVDYAEAQALVKEALSKILSFMHFDAQQITTGVKDEQVTADIKSTDGSLIIGKNGQTLAALEHAVNLIVNKNESTRVKVVLDTENYRGKQEERLVSMARKAADQVKTSGKAYRFDPMPAKDRRIIHLALKDNPDVESFSEGEGPFRKVGVKPRSK